MARTPETPEELADYLAPLLVLRGEIRALASYTSTVAEMCGIAEIENKQPIDYFIKLRLKCVDEVLAEMEDTDPLVAAKVLELISQGENKLEG